jgi:tetratricopeptide (TPR) repeat protein
MTPEHARQIFGHAVQFFQQGRLREAASICEDILASFPKSASAMLVLGSIEAREGKLESAEKRLLEAHELAPQDPQVLNSLGLVSSQKGDRDAAIRWFERAIALKPDFAPVWYNMANALAAQGSRERAIAAFRKAIQHDPNYAEAYAALARALMQDNQFDEARAAGERARALHPGHGLATITLAEITLREGGDASAAFADLDAVIANPATGPANRAIAHGLKAQVLESEGRHDEAFAAYTAANDTLHETYAGFYRDLRSVASPAVVEDMIAFLENEDPASWPPAGEDDGDAPVFLVGFPRSGTTLLDQILSSHPDIAVVEEKPALVDAALRYTIEPGKLDDLRGMDAGEAQRYRRLYREKLRQYAKGAGKKKIIIDKLPLNLAQLTLIHRLFPQAKIIFALRDPRDAVLSCFQQRFELNPEMAQFLKLETAAAYYDRVMTLAQLSFDRLPIARHTVRYEDVVKDLRGAVEPVLDFLGLEWDEAVENYRETAKGRVITTPSAAQVVRPIYESSQGKWRRYESALAPVLPVLASWVSRYGYAD